MNKGFTGIYVLIGILIIAALGGAFYLGKIFNRTESSLPQNLPSPAQPLPIWTNSPPEKQYDEASGWKTYTDNYHFSIKYPPAWEIGHVRANYGFLDIYDPSSKKEVLGNGGMKSTVYERILTIGSVETTTSDSPEFIVDHYINRWKDIYGVAGAQELEQTRGRLIKDGAYYVIYTDFGVGSQGRNIAITKNGTLIQINASIDKLEDNKIENKILFSLKFLRP